MTFEEYTRHIDWSLAVSRRPTRRHRPGSTAMLAAPPTSGSCDAERTTVRHHAGRFPPRSTGPAMTSYLLTKATRAPEGELASTLGLPAARRQLPSEELPIDEDPVRTACHREFRASIGRAGARIEQEGFGEVVAEAGPRLPRRIRGAPPGRRRRQRPSHEFGDGRVHPVADDVASREQSRLPGTCRKTSARYRDVHGRPVLAPGINHDHVAGWRSRGEPSMMLGIVATRSAP